ncbi:hypothetical protein B0H11DRAFT_1928371 [Mycena galericulata]|nr:hypothetical protein B0H11DRAFT_1928371 [Mycena galericulata]
MPKFPERRTRISASDVAHRVSETVCHWAPPPGYYCRRSRPQFVRHRPYAFPPSPHSADPAATHKVRKNDVLDSEVLRHVEQALDRNQLSPRLLVMSTFRHACSEGPARLRRARRKAEILRERDGGARRLRIGTPVKKSIWRISTKDNDQRLPVGGGKEGAGRRCQGFNLRAGKSCVDLAHALAAHGDVAAPREEHRSNQWGGGLYVCHEMLDAPSQRMAREYKYILTCVESPGLKRWAVAISIELNQTEVNEAARDPRGRYDCSVESHNYRARTQGLRWIDRRVDDDKGKSNIVQLNQFRVSSLLEYASYGVQCLCAPEKILQRLRGVAAL